MVKKGGKREGRQKEGERLQDVFRSSIKNLDLFIPSNKFIFYVLLTYKCITIKNFQVKIQLVRM